MKTKAYLYIITAAICWGLIGLFVRTLAAQGFSSMQIVALRSLAAAICVTLPLLRSGSAALRIRLRDLWLFIGTGICSLVFFNYCYFNAMQQTSLAVAALLLYTAPVFVMLMSLLCFGEAFTRTKALALLLTFSGCACVTGVFGSSLTLTLSGLLYGLGSGFGYALYSIFGKYANIRHSPSPPTPFIWHSQLHGRWQILIINDLQPSTCMQSAALYAWVCSAPYFLICSTPKDWNRLKQDRLPSSRRLSPLWLPPSVSSSLRKH